MNAEDLEIEKKERQWFVRLLVCGVVILGLIFFVGDSSHGESGIEEEDRASGYWGEVTSTIDWCEANYDVSFYTAEFWNTISNIFFISFAFFGLWTARNDEYRILIGYLGIASIGFGSALFHGTLLFEAQLCDELPMLYYMLSVLYIMIEFDTVEPQWPWVAPALALFAGLFTAVYYMHPFPTLFQIFWGVVTVYTIYRIIVKSHLLPYKDRFMLKSSVYFLIAAAFVWILEQAFCSPFIRQFRLHALWHLGTAIAAYVSLTGVYHLRCRYVLKFSNVRVEFLLGMLPYVAHDPPSPLPSKKTS